MVQRRLWELVIFSFAIDRLVKSYGKHHQSPQAYCVDMRITSWCKGAVQSAVLHRSARFRLAVRREGAGMAFGSVRQACISSQKLSPPPPSVLCHELFRTLLKKIQKNFKKGVDN